MCSTSIWQVCGVSYCFSKLHHCQLSRHKLLPHWTVTTQALLLIAHTLSLSLTHTHTRTLYLTLLSNSALSLSARSCYLSALFWNLPSLFCQRRWTQDRGDGEEEGIEREQVRERWNKERERGRERDSDVLMVLQLNTSLKTMLYPTIHPHTQNQHTNTLRHTLPAQCNKLRSVNNLHYKPINLSHIHAW